MSTSIILPFWYYQYYALQHAVQIYFTLFLWYFATLIISPNRSYTSLLVLPSFCTVTCSLMVRSFAFMVLCNFLILYTVSLFIFLQNIFMAILCYFVSLENFMWPNILFRVSHINFSVTIIIFYSFHYQEYFFCGNLQ